MVPLTVAQFPEASPNVNVSSQVYNSELEDITEFKGLTDFCSTFKLQRGKNEKGDDDPTVVGELKVRYWCFICKLPKMSIYYWLQKANIHWFVYHQGSFKVYPLPDDPSVAAPPRQFRELPDSGPQECLVRVYVVQAIDLQPKDNNGRVRINLLHNSASCIANSCLKTFFFPCSVWSIHKDLAWEEFSWRQRSLHTQHYQPCVWKVNVELCRRDYMEHYCLCFSNLPFCFVQDVWDDLFPAPGERFEDLCLWLWSPDSWWESRRDHNWSGEPFPVSIQLLLWPTTDLLHVGKTVFGSSQGTWFKWIHRQNPFFFFNFLFFAISVLVSTSGGTSWSHPKFWRTWLVWKACPNPGLKTTAHHSSSMAESTPWLNLVNHVSLYRLLAAGCFDIFWTLC